MNPTLRLTPPGGLRSGSLPSRSRSGGFTMTEMLIAITITLIASVVVFQVFQVSDVRRRVLASGNDAQQTGAIAAHQIERLMRMAGANATQFPSNAYIGASGREINRSLGCRVEGDVTGFAMPWGASITLPAPFDNAVPASGLMSMAPVLIAPGTAGEHVLVLMHGSGSGLATYMGNVTEEAAAQLRVPTQVGFALNDHVLVFPDPGSAAFGLRCAIRRITAAPAGGLLTLSSSPQFGSTAITGGLQNLGPAPAIDLYGVNADRTALMFFNLLDGIRTGVAPVVTQAADNVMALRALYGLDTNLDGTIDTWSQPAGDYSYANLTDGTQLAAQRLQLIRAVRVGMLVRSPRETDSGKGTAGVGPTTVSLFAEIDGGAQKYDLGSGQGLSGKFRVRTVEFTVPLRAAMTAGVGGPNRAVF